MRKRIKNWETVVFKLRKKARGYSTTQRRLFHGVAVKPGEKFACSAARQIAGDTYLADEAPRLPLDRCDNPRACKCIFTHLEDRRSISRRDADVGLPPRYRNDERRDGMGRRLTDSYRA